MNGKQYRARRNKLGYTQQELADIFGLDRRTIIRRESPGSTISDEARRAILSINQTKTKQ